MDFDFDSKRACCFTGHRDIPKEKYESVAEAVKKEIKKLYSKGVRHFIAGGALGFDMICSEVAEKLRGELLGITFTLALPCEKHDTRWQSEDRIRFSEIFNKADSIKYVSAKYEKGCMLKRNRFMVDNSTYCISYCTRKTGGSYYTVNYAEAAGKNIIEISGKFSKKARSFGKASSNTPA